MGLEKKINEDNKNMVKNREERNEYLKGILKNQVKSPKN